MQSASGDSRSQRGTFGNAARCRGLSAPSRIPALAPFRVRSFRFQWPADLATSWAFEMETLILGWYVLVETGSVLLLSIFASLQFLGTLPAPMFGVLGDRIGHRNLLCAMRAIYTSLATTLMLFAFSGVLSPVHVFVIAALMGVVRPSDLVMRNALIGETMRAEQLMGAMSVSRTTADSARIAGALAGAGLVAALGMAAAYAVISGLYATSLLLTLGVARKPLPSAVAAEMPPRGSPWRDLRDALAYVWTRPHLLAAMSVAFLINLTAYPFSNGLLPYVAKEIYAVDRTALGYLVASFAAGGLIGSILLSRNSGALRPARMMIVFGVAWYLLILVFGQLDTMLSGTVVLAVTGFMQSLCLVPMSVMLLRSSEAELRGRVMGLRMLAVYGLPLGLLGAGPLIRHLGFAETATLYATVGLAFMLLILLVWRKHIWPMDAPANAR